jgi:hypothetical protein
MAMNPLPPQAYTKETLQKAYHWLLNQSPSIKEMASTQEMLVSLYLKAQRNGEASLEAPSIQNFKQELKSLATMMGDFTPTQAPANPTAVTIAKTMPTAQIQTNTMPSSFNELDNVSLTAIQEVKNILNLSSDTEALRALIALGHKQFRKIN